MTDPWKHDDTLSSRTRSNAAYARDHAVAVMVDIQAGAFAGSEVMAEIDRAIECLTVAKHTAEQRWTEFLDSKHQEKAA